MTIGLLLYDDARARRFEPFATSRPLGECRAGALLVRERWELTLATRATGFASGAQLAGFAEFEAPPFVTTFVTTEDAPTWIVNTRALPTEFAVEDGVDVVHVGNRVAAVRVPAVSADVARAMQDGSLDVATLAASGARATTVAGRWLDDVWDIVALLSPLLAADIPELARRVGATQMQEGVFAEAGATIESPVVFDASAGPILFRRGSSVQAFTRVVGPCYVGIDSTIMADKIAASSIGDVCRVHGELSSSVFIGHANKGHDGFVGHSIVGRWVNMGAGTITSNLKNTYGTVALWTPDGIRDTGLQFLGTLFGDHAKTGIGMRLTTGCVLGAGANVMDRMPPKYVAPFSWGTGEPYAMFAAEKFVETATRMMARRHVELGEAGRAFWSALHARVTAHRTY